MLTTLGTEYNHEKMMMRGHDIHPKKKQDKKKKRKNEEILTLPESRRLPDKG